MPIPRELRAYYPPNWPEISAAVRFGRAGGRCEGCGRPHGARVACLPDGRWFDAAAGDWRGPDGARAPWPDIVEIAAQRTTWVILATCHRDHDPRHNAPNNLMALCQRCHLLHDRAYHRARRRLRYLLRRARGDLFLGPYSLAPGWPPVVAAPAQPAA
jgi:hypothetical protein